MASDSPSILVRHSFRSYPVPADLDSDQVSCLVAGSSLENTQAYIADIADQP